MCKETPKVAYEFNGVKGLCLVDLLVMHDDSGAQGADGGGSLPRETEVKPSAPALSAGDEHDRQEAEAAEEDAAVGISVEAAAWLHVVGCEGC
jgi:hypothetical protein